MDLITDERLREIVGFIAPLMDGDPYPDVKTAPDDPTERATWFADIAQRRDASARRRAADDRQW